MISVVISLVRVFVILDTLIVLIVVVIQLHQSQVPLTLHSIISMVWEWEVLNLTLIIVHWNRHSVIAIVEMTVLLLELDIIHNWKEMILDVLLVITGGVVTNWSRELDVLRLNVMPMEVELVLILEMELRDIVIKDRLVLIFQEWLLIMEKLLMDR